MKVLPGELQHRLVVVDVEESKLKKSGKKSKRVRWRMWMLKEKEIKEEFEQRVVKLVDTEAVDLWESYKNGVLKACDELCGKTKGRRDQGNTWWWNEQVKEAINRKKKAFNTWCKNRSPENKNNYRKARNQTKEVVAKAMKQAAEEEMKVLCDRPNEVFKLVKFMRKNGKDVNGGGCMKDKDGKLVVSEKDRGKLWKDYMEKIMNVENEWDQMAKADMVEGPVEEVTYEEVIKATNKMKLGKAAGPSEVNIDMIMASGKFGVGVLKKLYQGVLDGKGMPEEWKTSVVVPIFKGKEDVMNCGAYRGVKLLEHAMKIVERVLEERIRELLVKVGDMQFGYMPGKGTTDALFILRRMQEEFRGRKKKLCLCFVDLEKAFDRVPRKGMEWVLRKKSLPEVLVKAVMSLYEGSKTKVRVGSGLSEEFGVRVGVHQGSVISPLIFAIVLDAVTEQARKGLLNEILYADDLVLMSKNLEDLRERFQRWRDALESKGMKVNIRKTKMLVSGAEGEIVRSKVDPCGICGKRVMSVAMLRAVCKKWIHARCAQTKKVSCSFAQQLICRRCEDIGDGKEEPVEVLCDEVEIVKGFCYLGDRLNASGECETAVTARVRIG